MPRLKDATATVGPLLEKRKYTEALTALAELREPVDMKTVQPMLVERGVWLRPFGRLVYTMPPYTMGDEHIAELTGAMVDVVGRL